MKAICKRLLIAVLCIASGCTLTQPTIQKEVVIILDLTDPLRVRPNPEEIFALLNLDKEQWDGVRVTVTYISDKDVNSTYVFELPQENSVFGNPQIRAAILDCFKNDLRASLLVNDSLVGQSNSIIFRILAKQLTALVTSKSEQKYVLIYSNLMENAELNFYDPEIISEIQTQPKQIQEQLEHTMPVPDLTNVKIWLIYDPASYAENGTYMTIAQFFQKMFQEKHGKVVIANSVTP